jgi:hypothetical protein
MRPRDMQEMIKLQLLNDEDVPTPGASRRMTFQRPGSHGERSPNEVTDPDGDSVPQIASSSRWWNSWKLHDYYLRMTGRSPASQQRPGY